MLGKGLAGCAILGACMCTGCAVPRYDVPYRGGEPTVKSIVDRIQCEIRDMVRDDRNDAASLARRANDIALQRRQSPTYKIADYTSGNVHVRIDERPRFASQVPDVNRPSDGKVKVGGRTFLYAYRLLPQRGLLLLRPESSKSAEWRPFLRDLLLAGLVGAAFAALSSFVLARSIARPIARVADASRALAADVTQEPLPPPSWSPGP